MKFPLGPLSTWILATIAPIVEMKIRQTNLLFIMFDDLRPELSIYGKTHMITPNFERLADRSVTFENSYCQIAVCNPSRDSMLSGLRPDTLQDYGFQNSYGSNNLISSQLAQSGYHTAGFGKIRHWDGADSNNWTHNHTDYDWYGYQNSEYGTVKASSFPDPDTPVEKFRDYRFTSDAIYAMQQLHKKTDKYFMVAVGYKLPHLMVHFPHKYREMYRNVQSVWDVNKKELKFPPSAPMVGYKCCALQQFAHLNNEGKERANRHTNLGNVNEPFPPEAYKEIMWGYSASITFLDEQIGRLLDTLDELQLWNNITIVLTSDHGMHNGEKGLWEKWTLYDEATHVPLVIYHPDSTNKGKRYDPAVESIDIFPTLNDILGASFSPNKLCKDGRSCLPLQGKSLAPVVMGEQWVESNGGSKASSIRARTARYEDLKAAGRALAAESNYEDPFYVDPDILHAIPAPEKEDRHLSAFGYRGRRLIYENSTKIRTALPVAFALSQAWRCAWKNDIIKESETGVRPNNGFWFDCDVSYTGSDQVNLMGYSVRSQDFRYTAYLHFDRKKKIPIWELPPVSEELYDHRGETTADLGHKELINVAKRPGFEELANSMRKNLIDFLRHHVVYQSQLKH